jgi:hypothetical protein
MTLLQMVNQVLVRLRESEVSSVDQNAYSKLIKSLLNQTKREVEDAWNWVLLRNTIQVTTESGVFSYTLTDAGNRFRMLHVFNDTDDFQLHKIPAIRMTKLHNGSETQQASPIYFDYNGTTNGDPVVDLWPVPDGAYTLNFDMVLPQVDLASDEDEILIPYWPIVLGTYAKALAERGEDGGFMYREAESNYQSALSDAIAIDAMNVPSETMWTVQ